MRKYLYCEVLRFLSKLTSFSILLSADHDPVDSNRSAAVGLGREAGRQRTNILRESCRKDDSMGETSRDVDVSNSNS